MRSLGVFLSIIVMTASCGGLKSASQVTGGAKIAQRSVASISDMNRWPESRLYSIKIVPKYLQGDSRQGHIMLEMAFRGKKAFILKYRFVANSNEEMNYLKNILDSCVLMAITAMGRPDKYAFNYRFTTSDESVDGQTILVNLAKSFGKDTDRFCQLDIID